MSNEQPTKALVSVIFKSITSKYEDVVAMVPLTKMDSSVLHKLFNDVMNAITTIGYDAQASLVDGHSSNVKFYKKELCADKPTSFIPHPLDQHRFLYLLYDTTHIFKRICNNFQKNIFFECSKYEEITTPTNFWRVEFQNLSMMNVINQNLNDECLNPHAIEKT